MTVLDGGCENLAITDLKGRAKPDPDSKVHDWSQGAGGGGEAEEADGPKVVAESHEQGDGQVGDPWHFGSKSLSCFCKLI